MKSKEQKREEAIARSLIKMEKHPFYAGWTDEQRELRALRLYGKKKPYSLNDERNEIVFASCMWDTSC